MKRLSGCFHVLMLYDVSEQIQLDRLRKILGLEPPLREPSFKHPAPEYVRFERPPVVEQIDPLIAASGETFRSLIKYYDYGILSLELTLPFECEWDELTELSARWIASTELDRAASDIVHRCVERTKPALVEPYARWLSEEYYVVEISRAENAEGQIMSAAELLAQHGGAVSQLVRGESAPLSEAENHEALQAALSYYPGDLLVAGWIAAVVYDTPEGAAPTMQLLEYANTQLLEFRHYDEVLSSVLADVYQRLEHKGGLFRSWRMKGEAERLNTIRLEITELTDRTDNAIKFLSDMFYARAYKTAAGKVGVSDYRDRVEEKLKTAGELYAFMMNEFHQARAFILEALVVAILIVDLVMLFRGTK